MRYVRTKDGRILDLATCFTSVITTAKEDIIKESDSIEELCDYWVITTSRNKFPLMFSTEHCSLTSAIGWWVDIKSENKNCFVDLYGGIITTGEKGEPIMKPVAILDETIVKSNYKEALCLLEQKEIEVE